MTEFIHVDFEYTGGGIWQFSGKIIDGTFFRADGDLLDVALFRSEQPLANEPDFSELIRFLHTETESPMFFMDMFRRIREERPDEVYKIAFIEKEVIKYNGKTGWR